MHPEMMVQVLKKICSIDSSTNTERLTKTAQFVSQNNNDFNGSDQQHSINGIRRVLARLPTEIPEILQ